MNLPPPLSLFAFRLVTGLSLCTSPAVAQWELTWADEFDAPSINTSNWDVLTRRNSFNQELQYYVPEQASIAQTDDGRSVLRITATDEPLGGKPYRSARLESNYAQAYGRFEVSGRVPTTKGIWPAAWLLPRDVAWPLGGEIDILEHAGSRPNVVSSAYHWNNVPNVSQFVYSEYVSPTGEAWADDFHEYAVEWDARAIRYFVDGVNHFTVTPDMAPISSTPMSVILNTAVGGFFDGNPDATTQFPNTFDVDYVRAYRQTSTATNLLIDGDLAEGSSAWSRTGNTFLEDHDPHFGRHAFDGFGDRAFKIFGFGDSKAFQQNIAVEAGGEYTLQANVRINGIDSIANTANALVMWMEFFNAQGESVGSEGGVIADGNTNNDTWLLRELMGIAPDDAVTAGIGFEFIQPLNQGGAVWIDRVSLTGELITLALAGDYNGNGTVDAADYTVWQDRFGSRTLLDADGNGDGIVDAADYTIWQDNFGAGADTSPSFLAGAISVPEPGTCGLLILSGVLLSCRQRQRQPSFARCM